MTDLAPLLEYSPAPRQWQSEALRIWADTCKGTVEVATGAGKTTFSFLCMREFATTRPTARFLIIVPTSALLDQWVVALKHEVGCSSVAVMGEHAESRSRFVVAIINSARDRSATLSRGGSWFLCVDECHRAGSEANARALQGSWEAALGLSATPRRQYDAGFEQRVAPILGDVVYEYPFKKALEDGVVTRFDLHNYEIPMLPHEEAQYQMLSARIAREFVREREHGNNDARVKMLLHRRSGLIASLKFRIPTAVAIALRTNRRTLIFHERINAAEEIARLLEKNGKRCATYHSRMSPGLRAQNLLLFREGVIQVLIACRGLDEGFNVPEAEVGILAASTRSARQRIQRLGRVIRRSPGKESAQVCTIYGTPVEERVLRKEASLIGEAAEVQWFSSKMSDG